MPKGRVMFVGWLLVGIGVLLLIAGVFVRFSKSTGLIAGSDPERVTDKAALSRWFAYTLGGAGLLLAAVGVINVTIGNERTGLFSAIGAMMTVMFMSIIMLAGYQKYCR